jgi:hypothetical protein
MYTKNIGFPETHVASFFYPPFTYLFLFFLHIFPRVGSYNSMDLFVYRDSLVVV